MPGIKQKSDAEKAGVSCNAFGIAVLTSQIAKNGEQEDGWRMLLPAGYFKAKDGRPFEMDIAEKGWFIDHAIATNLINDVAALKQDLPVDYEHQTINSAKNGLPAPASGWFNQAELKWQNDGLYIRPRWTKTAAAFLKNDEYRFLSAVFVYDAKTGYPQKLLSVALTNDPALTGMEELTQIAALKKYEFKHTTGDSQSG